MGKPFRTLMMTPALSLKEVAVMIIWMKMTTQLPLKSMQTKRADTSDNDNKDDDNDESVPTGPTQATGNTQVDTAPAPATPTTNEPIKKLRSG